MCIYEIHNWTYSQFMPRFGIELVTLHNYSRQSFMFIYHYKNLKL